MKIKEKEMMYQEERDGMGKKCLFSLGKKKLKKRRNSKKENYEKRLETDKQKDRRTHRQTIEQKPAE